MMAVEVDETGNLDASEPHRKLTKEELAAFAPKCAWCGKEISEERQVRRKRTCSDEHTKHLNQFKRFLQSKIRCSSCGRPSTPAEREDFKAWRAARGEVLKSIGRGAPRKTREKQLEAGIKEVIETMKALDRELANAVPERMEPVFGDLIASLEKIVAPTQPE